MSNYFPQGVAVKNNFCNRIKERARLKDSIESHEHIVLIAPRRYGVTSLITQVLLEIEYPSTSIDLASATSREEVKKCIAVGISEIISQLMPKTKSSYKKFLTAFKKYNPKLTINVLGQQLEISSQQPGEESISELLIALDHVAQNANQTCVVVFDAFQQIANIDQHYAIEATIRHALERSKNVSYIFCGKKQKALQEIFSNSARPLYHLCDLMTLQRISSLDYYVFINKKAKQRWQTKLSDAALEEILILSQNHPYYVNTLARLLWHQDKPPSQQTVQETWQEYINQQHDFIINEVNQLSELQKRVLCAAITNSYNDLQELCNDIDIPLNKVNNTLKKLQAMDLIIYDNKVGLKMLDPAVCSVLKQKCQLVLNASKKP